LETIIEKLVDIAEFLLHEIGVNRTWMICIMSYKSESWKVLEILECLTNNKIATSPKEKVKLLILKLVKSGTPISSKFIVQYL
jgi:hypothetical protein